jgi:plastocyanin
MAPAKNGGKRITIRIDGDDITVSPTATHVDKGNKVTFQLDDVHGDGSFLITFPDGEAFNRTQLRGKEREVVTVPASKKGVFHYQVAIFVDGRIYADSGCPTIIIR